MKFILMILTTMFMIVAYSGGGENVSDATVIAKKAEEKRKGFHCLSAWDGSNRSLVRTAKNSMKDPKSFEHVETRIAPVVNGQHIITMTYRGRNGFGGMVVENTSAYVSNATCNVLM